MKNYQVDLIVKVPVVVVVAVKGHPEFTVYDKPDEFIRTYRMIEAIGQNEAFEKAKGKFLLEYPPADFKDVKIIDKRVYLELTQPG